MYTTNLYFEAHVTIEPVFDDRYAQFVEITKKFQFRAAELLMKKRSEDTPIRSMYDTFCTGRSSSYEDLHNRLFELTATLRAANFKVWRYKIENTLLDVRIR